MATPTAGGRLFRNEPTAGRASLRWHVRLPGRLLRLVVLKDNSRGRRRQPQLGQGAVLGEPRPGRTGMEDPDAHPDPDCAESYEEAHDGVNPASAPLAPADPVRDSDRPDKRDPENRQQEKACENGFRHAAVRAAHHRCRHKFDSLTHPPRLARCLQCDYTKTAEDRLGTRPSPPVPRGEFGRLGRRCVVCRVRRPLTGPASLSPEPSASPAESALPTNRRSRRSAGDRYDGEEGCEPAVELGRGQAVASNTCPASTSACPRPSGAAPTVHQGR
jgi:hypothetical protein